MKRLFLILVLAAACIGLRAQTLPDDPYPVLGAKLEEYFTALAGESADVQAAECDFLISSCQDSLVRQYVALKIYSHYLESKIMGDDAVAVHVAEKWFLSGAVPMASEMDLFNARIFTEFNRESLVGKRAPVLTLKDGNGTPHRVPASGEYSVVFFYDTSCPVCRTESVRLRQLAQEGIFPFKLYAVYVGQDRAAWDAFKADFPFATHVWDPQVESDYQRKYGVLQTPSLFLVNSSGTIVGRGLDAGALRILLNREFSTGVYNYGEASNMARYSQLFSAYGDTLSVNHIIDVADYLAARTFGEGNIDSFKQLEGDLLYFLSRQREEVYKDAIPLFVERFIRVPEIWDTENDRLQVVSLADMLCDLVSRTPVGSQVPDLAFHATLRKKPCLFSSGSKTDVFGLRSLKGRPAYVVFYSQSCPTCQDMLSRIDALVEGNRRARVLLVNMDELNSTYPDEARQALDSFDLQALPFILELDRKGNVVHRYVQL